MESTGELAEQRALQAENQGAPGAAAFDYLHPNTVTFLPRTPLGDIDERFRAGNLLVCFRNVNLVAILDQDHLRVVWSWQGRLERPHHPPMLENGHILIFDNGVVRGYSSVVELDPLRGEVVWEYQGDPPESFYSKTKGSAQRLPNGNTLICEGAPGRVFEVTRDGEVVWEWLNPLVRDDHRGSVYRMSRIAPELVHPFLGQH